MNGVVLAGGESARMGFDKSLVSYHGKPQRDYLFGMLQAFCDKVFTSCKAGQSVPDSLNPLEDRFPDRTPLNGILTALLTDESVPWISVPVDMPGVDAAVISSLIQNRDSSKVATCFYDADGVRPEPLLAIWEPGTASLLKAYHDGGGHSPREFLMSSNAHIVRAQSKLIHANVNTEADLRKYLEGGHSA